jgi:nitrate/TMAO reductase-like tetraheme cytochrome c subunit
MRVRLVGQIRYIGWYVLLIAAVLFMTGLERLVQAESKNTYVGSETCEGCHEKEYKNFMTYAKKSHSYNSIKAMRKGLTDAEFRTCFECHTTAYGQPGGFRSEVETPHLKDAGCEVCHGPGSAHVESGNPKDIKRSMTEKDCVKCHSPERVDAFSFTPLVHGGAH